MDSDRKTGVPPGGLRACCPQQRARYLVYQPPTDQVKAWVAASRKRCAQWRTSQHDSEPQPPEDLEDRKRQNLIVGQLKAAEARSRLCSMRHNYQALRHWEIKPPNVMTTLANKSKEIKVMLACQSSVQAAIRLELLLLTTEKRTPSVDWLDHRQRRRVEEIMKDDKGLTLIRS